MASRNFLTYFGLPPKSQGPPLPRSLALSLRLPSAAAVLGLLSNISSRGLLSNQPVESVAGKSRQPSPSEWNWVTGAGIDSLLGGQPVVLGAATGVVALEAINGLMSVLGLRDEKVAQAVAGAVLNGVTQVLEKNHGKDTAAKFESQVPELADWRSIAAKLLSSKGGLPTAISFFLDEVRGQPKGSTGAPAVTDVLTLIDICRKLDIDVMKVAEVAPIIFQFLRKKVEPALLAKIKSGHPLLAAAADAFEAAQAAAEAKKNKNDKKGGKKR